MESITREIQKGAANRELELLAELPVNSGGSVRAVQRLCLRLFFNARRLGVEYKRAAGRDESENSPMDELLAEDFYVIEKHLKASADALVELRKRRLPIFLRGAERGNIRIFALAELFVKRFVSDNSGRICADGLSAFFGDFQNKTPLSSRELSALDEALRFALIDETAALICGEHRIFDAQSGEKTGELARAERLSRLVTLFNSLSDSDIAEAADAINPSGKVLEADAVFSAMDRESRSVYICAVEKLAKKTGLGESAVAAEALALCNEAAFGGVCANALEHDKTETALLQHVGYYLIGNGRRRLVARLMGKSEALESGAKAEDVHWRLIHEAKKPEIANKLRLFALLSVKLALSAALSLLIGRADKSLFSAVLAFLPVLAAVDAVLMRFSARLFKPRALPRLALEGGIDAANKTLVCVPVLIGDEKQLDAAIKTVQRHYLASMERNAEYCVLGDFPDSENERNDGEDALLERAGKLVGELNLRYAQGSENAALFHFIHRKRMLSKADGRYMGRERKRGAVEALVNYMVSGEESEFSLNAPTLGRDFRYLLVLDADTVLPPGALRRLVGAAAHPMNRPLYTDDFSKKPYAGYNIIVPRMTSSSRSAAKSCFCTLISGESGVSSYSMHISDFFFDVFAAANFGGKGLLDIHGFHRAVRGTIPENTVLSHDMLEGELSRAALDSATVLYDGEPASFFAWFKRRHRWLRGDMQLAPFLSKGLSNRLGAVSKYKILLNIFGGFVNASFLMAFAAGAFLNMGALTIAFIFCFFISTVLSALDMLKGILFLHRKSVLRPLVLALRRRLMELCTLPYSAYRDTDAMLRAAWRMRVSHKNMLEWQTAADAAGTKGKRQYLRLIPASAFGALAMLNAAKRLFSGAAAESAAPWERLAIGFTLLSGFLMLLSPLIIMRLDGGKREYGFSSAQREKLTETARRIWRFFEENQTENRHFLPPDNVQLDPPVGAWELTSPTNIGMAMMAAVSAHELGFIDANEMLMRLERLCTTVEKLEKWRGNPFNWYDTLSLSLPAPRFVSSVDCGNLFCCLVAAAGAADALEKKGNGAKTECEKKPDSGIGARAKALSTRLFALAEGMDLAAFYDDKRRLFSIGLDFENGRMSESCYDLYASEARLLSFAAVAFHKVEAKHWFSLSRLFYDAKGGRTLKSWSGTAFEYLMPLIFFETAEYSLQHETVKSAVLEQVLEARAGEPWGVSESGFYCFDDALRYQYHAFGSPSLALSRKRGKERVVAPYASLLALDIEPKLAMENLELLDKEGLFNKYGYYEAADFTGVNAGEAPKLVKSYMAHHQGMGLCAIANALTGGGLKKHFMSLSRIEASEQLLFESLPTDPIKLSRYQSELYVERGKVHPKAVAIKTDESAAAILSNGRYSVLLSAQARGVSYCEGTLLTRHRRESGAERGVFFTVTTDKSGTFADGSISAFPHIIIQEKRFGALKIAQRVIVSAERDCELRTLKLVNLGKNRLCCTVGAFAEIALASAGEDEAHPAFMRLCVDSDASGQMAVFTSRRLEKNKNTAAFLAVDSCERSFICTDGLRLPGRGGDALGAARKFHEDFFSNGENGAIEGEFSQVQPIEPFFSALTPIELEAGAAFELRLVCGFAKTEEDGFMLAHNMLSRFDMEARLSEAHTRGRLRALCVGSGAVELASRLAYALLEDMPLKKTGALLPYLSGNAADDGGTELIYGKPALWKFALSGDSPILLLHVEHETALPSAALFIGAVRYLCACGMKFELAIIGGYEQEYQNRLRARLEALCRGLACCRLINGHELTSGERRLLCAAALVDADAERGFEALFNMGHASGGKAKIRRKSTEKPLLKRMKTLEPCFDPAKLEAYNGFGGFDKAAGEYIIRLRKGERTPLPWSNCIAGERMGTLVTESGGGYTFAENARLYRLTPWSNDVLTDRKGEKVTLFDIKSGEYMELSRDDEGSYICAHGIGYTRFACRSDELELWLNETCDTALPIKYYAADIKNTGNSVKELALELEYAPVLGENLRREHIVSSAEAWGVRSVNPLSQRGETAFIALKSGGKLMSAKTGATSAVRIRCQVQPGATARLVLLLGSARRGESVEELIDAADYESALSDWRHFRSAKLQALGVRTGKREFDLLVNERLLYQLYSARLWGRTGFYQSGGATGFRDQLQDVCALLLTDSETARTQLLKSAAKQFARGDVLHWWHDDGRGVRTRIGDDRLFLPIVACEYAKVTGDMAIFDEICPYLEDKPIEAGHESRYERFENSGEGSLLEHCIRAIEVSVSEANLGAHGLPLMGAGDWNDGMDKLPTGSESTVTGFLALFAIESLLKIPSMNERAELCAFLARKSKLLRAALERAWSTKRYYRAYFADGEPLDIADMVTASFAVLAGLEHAEEGFDNAVSELVDYKAALIKLLSPPFKKTGEANAEKRIGYIENYVEGVRENGGQYTHAAAWAVLAACRLKRAEQAEEFFKMLNPVALGSTAGIEIYKAEPYAVCGDVYSTGRLAGRGGWSLYTGAAGWLYRAATEHILGLKKRGESLSIQPCTTLSEFNIDYNFGNTLYKIHAVRAENAAETTRPCAIALIDDGKVHEIEYAYSV